MKLNIKGHKVLIDEADYDLVKDYSWHLLKCSNTNYALAYCGTGRNNIKNILMHRLIMDAPDGIEVDHENGNGLDNRRSVNLRLITNAGNRRNSRRKNKTGYKGVIKHGRKFLARIVIQGKTIRIGSFDTVDQAGVAYQEAYNKQIVKEIVTIK